nr:uncharacterized protein LOC105488188 [Macaca nemestrina]
MKGGERGNSTGKCSWRDGALGVQIPGVHGACRRGCPKRQDAALLSASRSPSILSLLPDSGPRTTFRLTFQRSAFSQSDSCFSKAELSEALCTSPSGSFQPCQDPDLGQGAKRRLHLPSQVRVAGGDEVGWDSAAFIPILQVRPPLGLIPCLVPPQALWRTEATAAAPKAVRILSAEARTSSSITLSWAAPRTQTCRLPSTGSGGGHDQREHKHVRLLARSGGTSA